MIGLDKFCNQITTETSCVDSSYSGKQLTELDETIDSIASQKSHKVACFDLLPLAEENEGRMIYLNDKKCYYYSNGKNWLREFDSSCSGFGTRTLWTWGLNNYGQLGDNTTTGRSSPGTTIDNTTDWYQIAAGDTYTMAIKTDNTLWVWGSNFYGHLGDNTSLSRSSPVTTISDGTSWCKISNGSNHSIGLKTDGTIWTWGDNQYGQLGDNTVICRSSPTTTATGSNNWCQISAGQFHSLAIKTDGSLWSWGRNNAGQLGDGTFINRSSPVSTLDNSVSWCDIRAGGFHSLGIKSNGTLWSWGDNVGGQLGINNTTTTNSPTITIAGGIDWGQISAGQYHSLALKTDGTLWSWGCNICGALGDGTVINRSSPVTVATNGTNWCDITASNCFSLAVKTDGTLWSWGDNTDGQLGDSSTTDRSSPITVTSDTNWYKVDSGGSHVIAIKLESTEDLTGF